MLEFKRVDAGLEMLGPILMVLHVPLENVDLGSFNFNLGFF